MESAAPSSKKFFRDPSNFYKDYGKAHIHINSKTPEFIYDLYFIPLL